MPETQLCQILAVEKGVKSRAHNDFTAAYQATGKAPLLSGISRTYQPRDDEGERLPSEQTLVQARAVDLIGDVSRALTRLFDVTFTKDVGNTHAAAAIVVDGVTIATDVPATYLLFLEKQLVDLHTFVSKLPVLDPSETWTYDEATDAYATAPAQTTRSKKIPRNHVKADATDRHPAQVEMYFEDVLVGYWTTVKYSGALPQTRVNELKARVVKLADAVKTAREEANTTVVANRKIGEKVFDYLFSA